MIYHIGKHEIKVLDIREIAEENFNPMCHHLLNKINDIQIKIEFLGKEIWITVSKKEVTDEI